MRYVARTLRSALLVVAVGVSALGLVAAPAEATPAGLGPLVDIQTDGSHSCALTADGRIFCWGENNHGQLGDGTTVDATEPRLLPIAGTALDGQKVVGLALGATSSCALTSGGDVACWGDGLTAGAGLEQDVTRPRSIRTAGTPLDGKQVAKVDVGSTHGCALTTDGVLACWGNDADGELGTGTSLGASYVPVAVKTSGALAGRTITDVETGTRDTCAIASGNAYCWGDGSAGQLGNNTTTGSASPVAVTTTGTALAGRTLAQLAVGTSHTCARTTDNVLACWGWDGDGAIGDGGSAVVAAVPTPVAVAVLDGPLDGFGIRDLEAGNSSTCAVATNGMVACWGRNTAGVLGTGAQADFVIATAPAAVKTSGTPLDGRGVKEVSVGGNTACALTTDGIGTCWGSRSSSQTGDGWANQVATPSAGPGGFLVGKQVAQVVAEDNAACARMSTGQIACWGENNPGTLGRGDQIDSGVPAQTVVTSSPLSNHPAVDLAMGGGRACAVTDLSAIACWGGGFDPGWSTSPAAVSLTGSQLVGKQLVDVEADDEHSCVRTADNVLACWGRNTEGQLGNGLTSTAWLSLPTPVVTVGTPLAGKGLKEIALAKEATCALTTDGIVACWGASSSGQGGAGTTTRSTLPRAITTVGTPLEGKTVVDLAAGRSHFCALTSDGVVACWGGIAGTVPAGGALVPTAVDLTPPDLDGQTITRIEAGSYSTCAITQTGAMACSDGETVSTVPVAGSALAGGPVAAADGGNGFTCALVAASVGCWGRNNVGQLGLGDPYATVPSTLTWASSAPVVPAAPRTPSARATGMTQVTVSWTAPVGDGGSSITGYQVTPVIAGVPQPPTTVDASSTSAVVGGLVSGTTYTFSVAALNAVGASPGSATNAATPGTGAAPAAPPIVLAEPGDQQATLTWTPPTSDGGNPITGYRVLPSVAGAPLPAIDVPVGTTSLVTGLANSTTYSFRVAAVNARGVGVASPASNSVIPAVLPLVPSLNPFTVGDGQVTVAWDPPGWDGGSPVTGYVITPYLDGVAQPVTEAPATATSQVVTGLANGSSYKFRVAAVTGVGTGPQTADSATTVPKAAPVTSPSAPTMGLVTATATQAIIRWTPPTSNGGAALGTYVITPYVNGIAQATTSASSSAVQQTVSGLSTGTTYTFKIAAQNADAGLGPQSAASAPVTAGATPGAPSTVTVAAGNASVLVTWKAPTSSGSSALTGYAVTPYIGSLALTPTVVPAGALSTTVTGLVNGVAYRFKVAAVNASGAGAESSQSLVVTPTAGTGAPGAPTITAVSAGNGQAMVTWAAPTSDGGSPVTDYIVTPSVGIVALAPITSSGPGTSKLVSGLVNGMGYTFKVAAVNANGSGVPSAASTTFAPTGRTSVPAPPAIGATTPGDGQVTVNWAAPWTDGGSVVTGYVVTPYVGTVAQASVTSLGTGTSKVVTGLANGVTYTFRVAAVNALGTGAKSLPTGAVTPGGRPSAPTIGVATSSSGQATVTWTAPETDGGNPITGYLVTPVLNGVDQAPTSVVAPATSVTITGLTNAVSYRFKVAAVNAIGVGAASALSNAVIPAGVGLTGVGSSVVGETVVLKGVSTVGATGSMSFYDGTTLLGTKTVSLGSATLSTSKLTVGSHVLTVSHKLTSTSTPVVSDPATHVVNKGSTTLTLSSPTEPSVWGQSVKLKATVTPVAPSTGIPTGTVTFREGPTVLGTASLASGAAYVTVKPTVGAHTYTASFGGSSDYLASTSADLVQHVDPAATSTTVSASVNPSLFGQSVTVKAAVKTYAPGSGTPTGSVDFYEEGVFKATVALSGGVASLPTQKEAVGDHRYTAVYRGSSNSLGSTSPEFVQTVNPASTTVTITSSAATAPYGSIGSVTATVAVVSPGSGSTVGVPVEFYDGGVLIATVSVSGGKASILIKSLARGTHELTAKYVGSVSFLPSTSAVFVQTIT